MHAAILSVGEIVSGALSRYARDIYALTDRSVPFEEWQEQYWKNYDEKVKIRNIEHPIEVDFDVKIDQYRTVNFFKRSGEDWLCSVCDMAPNGGGGSLSFEDAVEYVQKWKRD